MYVYVYLHVCVCVCVCVYVCVCVNTHVKIPCIILKLRRVAQLKKVRIKQQKSLFHYQ